MRRSMLIVLLLICASVLTGAVTAAGIKAQTDPVIVEVPATGETVESEGDGATGVAIWVHPTDPTLSTIISGDDNTGIAVYELDGSLLQSLAEGGEVVNVDLRYNFPIGSRRVTLVAASIKDTPRVDLYTVDESSRLLVLVGAIDTGIRANGVCMYISRLTGTYYVFANSELGEVEQYALSEDDGVISASLARKMEVGQETEGCVVDDEYGRFYIAEEETSIIWRYGAEPENGTSRKVVDLLGTRIIEQIEGLNMYYASDKQGYLIAANEQGDSFLVYDRAGDNAFVGEFKITASATIDQVTEPNGLDVVNVPLGDQYPQGLFVTSDDVNTSPSGDNNYKLASWGEIAASLGLIVDTAYDPRSIGAEAVVAAADENVVSVTAKLETQPVPSGTDAADDPAIWIHPTDPTLSTIIGTDKTNGLVVYGLDGQILQEVNIGRVNNVDLRYNFLLNGTPVTLVTATNRTFNSLVIYQVNPETRLLEEVAAREIVSAVEEVYGTCMYVSPVSGKMYVFLNSADSGEVEQYELSDNGAGKVDAAVVRQFVVGSQTEGCVADDENAVVYIGEEGVGLWKYNAEPDADDSRTQVDNSTPEGNLTADTEGVALYYGANGTGYIIVSSQGSSTFVVYDRQGDNAYIGTFQVVETDNVDAVSGTDGLDVTNFPLNAAFPQGMVVVQDDLNIDPEESQNFKLIAWEDVAAALGLSIDTSFDPRSIGAQ